jgi:hypothetical protein
MTNDNEGTSAVLPFKPRIVTPEVTPSDQNNADPAIVKLFEDYLKAAKDGKIKFAALATVDADGVGYSTWEPEKSSPTGITQALGAVAYLNHRFNTAVIGDYVGED